MLLGLLTQGLLIICPLICHTFNVKIKILPSLVGLPDGQDKVVNTVGNVLLTQDPLLGDVQYVPDFKHSFLSVSKIVNQLGSVVIFTKDGCLFQDQTPQPLVANGQKVAGLYRVKGVQDHICIV